MAKCHDCEWAAVNDWELRNQNKVSCHWHLWNKLPATFGEERVPMSVNDDLAEKCVMYEIRSGGLTLREAEAQSIRASCEHEFDDSKEIQGYRKCLKCGLWAKPS